MTDTDKLAALLREAEQASTESLNKTRAAVARLEQFVSGKVPIEPSEAAIKAAGQAFHDEFDKWESPATLAEAGRASWSAALTAAYRTQFGEP